MVFGKFVTEEKDMELVREICRRVFVEELGLDQTGTMTDAFCLNALVYAGEQPAGMGVLPGCVFAVHACPSHR